MGRDAQEEFYAQLEESGVQGGNDLEKMNAFYAQEEHAKALFDAAAVEESSKKYRNLSFKEVSDLIRDIFIAQANAAAKDKNEELAKSLREAPEHPGFAALVERVLAKLIGSDDPRGDRVSEKRFVEAWGSVVPEFTTNMNKTDFDVSKILKTCPEGWPDCGTVREESLTVAQVQTKFKGGCDGWMEVKANPDDTFSQLYNKKLVADLAGMAKYMAQPDKRPALSDFTRAIAYAQVQSTKPTWIVVQKGLGSFNPDVVVTATRNFEQTLGEAGIDQKEKVGVYFCTEDHGPFEYFRKRSDPLQLCEMPIQ